MVNIKGYTDLKELQSKMKRNDCGLSHVSPDELSLVYRLVSDSSLSMWVQGTEQQGLYLTAALMTQSCTQNTR